MNSIGLSFLLCCLWVGAAMTQTRMQVPTRTENPDETQTQDSHQVQPQIPAQTLIKVPVQPRSQIPQNVGDTADGSRAVPVHLIKLYDEYDHLITLDDRPVMPFSPKYTCRKCHDYDKIRAGWHFNAGEPNAQLGRAGEPWILVDPWAATQIPLSYRRWKGTFPPGALGLSTLRFMSLFGRHLPGGGVAESDTAQDPDDYMRWQVSGSLDINCQSCHNADPSQSQAEYGVQVLRQNFRWAATASSGFATVRGSAGDLPDNYDLYTSVAPEKSNVLPPTVHYTPSRFDPSGRVLFEVPRRMPASQCYFCHSSRVVSPVQTQRWQTEEDVHIAAGMTCVDCHRNGLDHLMVRGYEGEAEETGKEGAASLTCLGCHLGGADETIPRAGRLGAPRPTHVGLPPVHFEKLACTACHSGPWPSGDVTQVKTSRAHGLGIPKINKADDALPHIVTPVYVKQHNGTYAPHNLFWPSFWAYGRGDSLDPVDPGTARPLIRDLVGRDTTRAVGAWPELRDSDVLTILQELRLRDSTRGTPLYVNAGRVYEAGPHGALTSKDHEGARPYAWPIAHDVRPAAQSLGVRGCDDCHAAGAPFHFGAVTVASPFVPQQVEVTQMTEYQDQSSLFPWLFSMSFLFRPALKMVVIVSFVIIASVVLIHALRGLSHFIRTLAAEEE